MAYPDLYIDPTTRDYVDDTTKLRQASGAQTRIYLALATKQGSAWWDPDLGSRLHELARSKATANKPQLALDYAKEALRREVAAGRVKNVTYKAELDATDKNRVNLLVNATDGRSGLPVTVLYPVV